MKISDRLLSPTSKVIVSDLDGYLKSTVLAGGKIIMDNSTPHDTWDAVVEDAAGTTIGVLHQANL